MKNKAFILAIGLILIAQPVLSAEANEYTGLQEDKYERLGWWDSLTADLPEIPLLNIGVSQPEGDGIIRAGEQAQFGFDKVCVQDEKFPINMKVGETKDPNDGENTGTVAYDPELYLVFEDSVTGKKLAETKAHELGYIEPGNCFSFAKNVKIPEKVNPKNNLDSKQVDLRFKIYNDYRDWDFCEQGDPCYTKIDLTGTGDSGKVFIHPASDFGDERKELDPVIQVDDDLRVGRSIKFRDRTETGGDYRLIDTRVWNLIDSDNNKIASSQQNPFFYNFKEPGEYVIQLKLDDSQGEDYYATEKFYIKGGENTPPEAKISSNKDNVVKINTVVQLTGKQSKDEDGSITAYKWSNKVGSGGAWRSVPTINVRKGEPTEKTYKLTVYDNEGDTDTEEITIKWVDESSNEEVCGDGKDNDGDGVVDENCDNQDEPKDPEDPPEETINYQPQINEFNVPDTATVGETIDVTVQASDRNEDDTLRIEWNNGDTGEATQYEWSDSGTKTVEVTVSDGKVEASKSTDVLVQDNDQDNDGVIDSNEKQACIDVYGELPNGCPVAPEPQITFVQFEDLFSNEIQNLRSTTSLNFLSSGGGEVEDVTAGSTISTTLTATAPGVEEDKDHTDGEFNKLYGKWAVIEGSGIKEESNWLPVQQKTFTKSFEREFNSNGEKAYYVVIARGSLDYNYENESWSSMKVSKIADDEYIFKVTGGEEPEGDESDPVGGTGSESLFNQLTGSFAQSAPTTGILTVIILALTGGLLYYRRQNP